MTANCAGVSRMAVCQLRVADECRGTRIPTFGIRRACTPCWKVATDEQKEPIKLQIPEVCRTFGCWKFATPPLPPHAQPVREWKTHCREHALPRSRSPPLIRSPSGRSQSQMSVCHLRKADECQKKKGQHQAKRGRHACTACWKVATDEEKETIKYRFPEFCRFFGCWQVATPTPTKRYCDAHLADSSQGTRCVLALSKACHQAKKGTYVCNSCWEVADAQQQESIKQYLPAMCRHFGCWEWKVKESETHCRFHVGVSPSRSRSPPLIRSRSARPSGPVGIDLQALTSSKLQNLDEQCEKEWKTRFEASGR